MIDKHKLTLHIRDEEVKRLVCSVLDKAQSVMRNHEAKSTDFLNPYELRCVRDVLNHLKGDIIYSEYGECSQAERKCVLICPWYMDVEEIESPISFLCVGGNFKFKEISHRDYLGSVMGLGIRREKIGDIHVHENSCHLAVKSEVADFLHMNFNKVSSNGVNVRRIDSDEFTCSEQEFKAKNFTVSSLRLDCVLSGMYNISRGEASKMVSSERVRVDFEPAVESSKRLYEGSLISVRGKGRAIIDSINGNTKKGRISVTAKIII